jgi:hypothetical protein
MGYVDELAKRQPRPSVDFSYPKDTPEIEIPNKNKNRVQFTGSSGREITLSGEVWDSSDVISLQDQIKNATVQTLNIPELQESIKVIPTNLNITEAPGTINRHSYELTVKELI